MNADPEDTREARPHGPHRPDSHGAMFVSALPLYVAIGVAGRANEDIFRTMDGVAVSVSLLQWSLHNSCRTRAEEMNVPKATMQDKVWTGLESVSALHVRMVN
ncbi:hypothetical protein V7S43_004616 [Phytophthora oleae]|uniref:Uncharacterized protein n=1 Tax=Phytophthora oleae TaxID=2107226 RepID=A0ABD3FTQ4_9STRA